MGEGKKKGGKEGREKWERKKRDEKVGTFSLCPARLGFSVRFWALRNARSLATRLTSIVQYPIPSTHLDTFNYIGYRLS